MLNVYSERMYIPNICSRLAEPELELSAEGEDNTGSGKSDAGRRGPARTEAALAPPPSAQNQAPRHWKLVEMSSAVVLHRVCHCFNVEPGLPKFRYDLELNPRIEPRYVGVWFRLNGLEVIKTVGTGISCGWDPARSSPLDPEQHNLETSVAIHSSWLLDLNWVSAFYTTNRPPSNVNLNTGRPSVRTGLLL
jgi:hypothetical protein